MGAYAKMESNGDESIEENCDSAPESSKLAVLSSGSDVLKCGPLRISKVYMVFEFCLCTIEEFMRYSPQNKVPEHLRKPYFVQMMQGVEYLHSRYIIRKCLSEFLFPGRRGNVHTAQIST